MSEEQNPIQTIQTTGSAAGELSSPVDLLKKSFELYKTGFKKFIGMMLVPLIGALPLLAVLMLWALLKFLLKDNSTVNAIINVVFGLIGIISVIIIILAAVISQAGLYILIRDASKNLSIKQAFLEAKKITWKFFIISIATGIFAFLWSFLLIVPGIWAAINYSFALWVFFYEDFKGTAALKRSKELVKGYWWAVFVRIIFIYILLFALTTIPSIIIKSIPNTAVLYQIWGVISNIISFLFTPFAVIYSCYMYWDLKKVKGEN